MENERDDRVIFLADLVFAALYQWRKLLIGALVFAVLLGGFSGIKQISGSSAGEEKETYLQQMEAYNSEVALLENRIAATQEYLKSQQEYLEKAPLMQLNAYQLYESVVVFAVQTEYKINTDTVYQDPDNLQALLRSYSTLLQNEHVLDAMAQVIDVPTKYAKELMWIHLGDAGTRTLSVGIRYTNPEQADAMLDVVINSINDNQPQIADSMGAHQLVLSTRSITEIMDTTIIDAQANAFQHKDTLTASLDEMTLQLEDMTPPANGAAFSFKSIVVNALIGAFLGLFLVAAWACAIHVMGAKVYSVRTLKNRTGLKVLGAICASEKQNPVDLWLRKLEGRNNAAQQADFLAVAVSTYCEKGAKVLLAGSCDESVRQDLLTALNTAGITAVDHGSLLTSPQALRALPEQDGVLLLAQCNVTPYRCIEEEMEIAADRSKLLGCILVNG